jgi:hypothetical protein
MRPLLRTETWQTGPWAGKYKLSRHRGIDESKIIAEFVLGEKGDVLRMSRSTYDSRSIPTLETPQENVGQAEILPPVGDGDRV